MNFSTLKTELADRGFNHLSDTRRGQFINWAYAELNGIERWPYLVATASGAAPLTINDLGEIDTVTDTANGSVSLAPADRFNLVNEYRDLTTTGTPSSYFIDNGVVRTYPVGGTLSVRYFKVAADLTGTDTPLAPSRFHEIIVDLAARRAYQDSDNFEAAQAIQAEADRKIALMTDQLLGQNMNGDGFQQITYSSLDW